MHHATLNTGAKMPFLGLGTWRSPVGQAGEAVKYALTEALYDHIDCAAIYKNEKEIGAAFKEVFGGARKREDVFLTSKLWNSEHRRDAVRAACEATLKDLNLEYLDLYLMHWGIAIPVNKTAEGPFGRWSEQTNADGVLITEDVSIRETWEAMEELVSLGLVKAIGVANFTEPMLVDLLTYAKIVPAVNQIELHPYLQQQDLVDFCTSKSISVTAYSPFGSPGNYKELPRLLEDPVIGEIAKKHGKTPAQILVRWAIERKTVVIPKSVTPARIKENAEVFDFSLDGEDANALRALDRNLRYVDPYVWWKIPYFG